MLNLNKDITKSIMMQFNEKLIERVRIHKILYNKEGFCKKSIQEKQLAWEQIAYSLGSTAAECSKRFKSLRERYSRELKTLETEGKSEDSVEWPYFKPMSFLRKYVKQRNPRSNLTSKDFEFVAKQLQDGKEISAEDSFFSDTCNPFYEISNENDMSLKQEMNSASEELNSHTEDTNSPANDVIIPRQALTTKEEIPKEYAFAGTSAIPKPVTAIQSFGHTVTAFLSEMNEAKQAKAMRLLFDTLITIKMEPDET